jgi:hypothetical protein
VSETLIVESGEFAICRLGANDAVPDWVGGTFISVTRTAAELSLIVDAACVPASVQAERGWRCLALVGPFPFSQVGVIAGVSAVLATEGIALLTVATFDTDYIFVKETMLTRATAALLDAGYTLKRRDVAVSAPPLPAVVWHTTALATRPERSEPLELRPWIQRVLRTLALVRRPGFPPYE